MRARRLLLVAAMFGMACGPQVGPIDTEIAGGIEAASGFEWGSDCSSGDGEMSQTILQTQTVTVGEIPKRKRNVTIALTSEADALAAKAREEIRTSLLE